MPRQKVFLRRQTGDRRIEVVKTYDKNFAREAFEDMDEAAKFRLWQSLGIDECYDPQEIASLDRGDILLGGNVGRSARRCQPTIDE